MEPITISLIIIACLNLIGTSYILIKNRLIHSDCNVDIEENEKQILHNKDDF